MIRVLFVVDGPRDQFIVPPIARKVVGIDADCLFQAWKTIRVNKEDQPLRGYESKLLFAMRLAVDSGLYGVVATVDTDKGKRGEKLRRLRNSRTDQRNNGITTPAALGEATPHAEAWLLDDESAVRDALALPPETLVPNVAKTSNPKDELDRLTASSSITDQGRLTLLGRIAEKVDPKRCPNAKTTGLRAFVKDVQDEFRTGCGGRDGE